MGRGAFFPNGHAELGKYRNKCAENGLKNKKEQKKQSKEVHFAINERQNVLF